MQFGTSLGFNVVDAFNSKQQSINQTIKEVFEDENFQTEYSISDFRVDLYFQIYKLAIEVDEFDHSDRDIDYEKKTKSNRRRV